MTNITDIYKKSLADVGITIGADKRLSVDEEKLKSADVSKLTEFSPLRVRASPDAFNLSAELSKETYTHFYTGTDADK